MKTFILLYTLTLANGAVLQSHKEAMMINNFKRVKTMEQCQLLASEQQKRLELGIEGVGNIKSVKVKCVYGNHRLRR